MAKKLKPPCLPPKEKILTKMQIEEMEKKCISVLTQIAQDTKGQKKILAVPGDAEWDHAFWLSSVVCWIETYIYI